MRGIVTLAAAIALPPRFPLRDMIVLTAFFVVLGTLLIQGLTLKKLLAVLDLRDGDPVAGELSAARQRVLDTVLATLPAGVSPATDLVRKDFRVRMNDAQVEAGVSDAYTRAHARAYDTALQSARGVLLAMRDSGDIGDDAFHALENELDWMEVSEPLRGANAEQTSPTTPEV